MTEEGSACIAGFWRRIGTFLFDGIMLGCIGFSLGFFLEGYFVQTGDWGRLIGFTVALVYFGLLYSTPGKEQTIGKKLLKLNVVNANNDFISIPGSFLRYSILGVPFFLNGARPADELLFSP